MGLLGWWRAGRERAEGTRRSLAINSDQELIAAQVPELAGMSEVEGMAYVMRQIYDWNKSCSIDEASIFAQRLQSSGESWKSDGLTMPYWGNLWVLRNYQQELRRKAPSVAQPVNEAYDNGDKFARDAVARLDEYVENHLAPRRHAFLAVFQGLIETLDERLPELDKTGQASREELAGIDYRIMLENWHHRRVEQAEEARNWLSVQLDQANALGCLEELSTIIEQELDRQKGLLTVEGLDVLLKVVPSYESGVANSPAA